MRKILIVLAGSLFIATSYADLGAITVSSFLNQRLNATIPISNFGTKVDYNNFAVDLADKDKFQQSGIKFNPELASLNFTVVKTNSGNVVKISSSRPIKSPVLSFVLHYQVNNNDFYRQYTVLLDPLEYSPGNSGVVTSVPNKNDRVIIARSDNTSYHSTVKPIPLVRAKTSTKAQMINSAVSYAADFNNNYVQQHLKQFNQSSFSYTTVKNDTIYSVAKFEQALYPKADLSINQIIIALGMENYRDLRPLSYLYESGAEIFLPEAKDVALISSDAADDYLLNTQLTNPQKIALLTQVAAKFDPNLEIDSPNLFSDINPMLQGRINQESALSKMKQKFTVIEPTPESNNSILDTLFDYKYYILGIFLSLGLILVFRARAKKSRQLADNIVPLQFSNPRYIDPVDEANIASLDDSHFTVDSIAPAHLQASEASLTNSVDVPNESLVAEKLPDLEMMTPTAAPEPSVSAPKEVNSVVDDELINTLEQILTFDSGRDDIKLKLFELYLSAQQKTKADAIYENLDNSLASDDPLRKTLIDVCTRYYYTPLGGGVSDLDSEAMPLIISEDSNAIDMVNEQEVVVSSLESEQQPLVDSVAVNNETDINRHMDYNATEPQFDNSFVAEPLLEQDINRTLDFSSSAILQPTPVENLVEPINFAAERVLDFGNAASFTATKPEEDITSDFEHVLSSGGEIVPPDPLDADDVEYEEKLNLSRMYYHIDEHQKARELLLEMKQNVGLPDKFKTQVNQLLADLGLDG
jgi:hypothetical protein